MLSFLLKRFTLAIRMQSENLELKSTSGYRKIQSNGMIMHTTYQGYKKVFSPSSARKMFREAKLLATNLKKLTAIDFQYHMWNRRMRLTSAVLEAAATDRVSVSVTAGYFVTY